MPATANARQHYQRYLLNIIAVALIAALSALVVGALQVIKQTQSLHELTANEADLDQRLRLFQSVLRVATNAETGQRGYLLTNKDRYLAVYQQALHQLPALLKRLENDSIEHPSQVEHIRAMRGYLDAKLAELQETIRLHDSGQVKAALALVQTDEGQHSMDGLRAENEALETIVRRDRDAAVAVMVESGNQNERFLVRSVAALVMIVILVFVQFIVWARSRRRYEVALQESREQLKTIVEEQTEFIAIANMDGTLTYVNPAFARHIQLPADRMIGRSLLEFIDAADHALIQQHLGTLTAGDGAVSAEYCTQTTGGIGHWTAWSIQIQPDSQGRPQFYSIGRDITDRKVTEIKLRASEDLLARTSRSARVGGWEFDLETRSLRWTNQIYAIVEAPGDFIPTLDNTLNWFQQDRAFLESALSEDSAITTLDRECQIVTYTGKTIWVRVTGDAERNDAGIPFRFVGALQDITQRKEMERLFNRQAATLNAVVEALPVMIAVWDAELRYRVVNRSFERWRGISRQEVLGRTIEEAVGTYEYLRSLPWIRRALSGETVSFEKDYPELTEFRHVDITYVPYFIEDGVVGGFIGVAQNITEHRDENLRLLQLSQRDPLTGLLNRAGFQGYLEQKIRESTFGIYAILYIDLDHFKPINDTHGHAVGDELLRQFALRLTGLVRPTDAVARLGGDEFGIALGSIRSLTAAQKVADKIVVAAKEPFNVGQLELQIGASVGVALGTPQDKWQQILGRADTMVYQAKSAGRGQRA